MRSSAFFIFTFFIVSTFLTRAHADDAFSTLLDDAFPTTRSSIKLAPESFRWKGLESFPAGSKVEILGGSIQWARIQGRITLPRARVRIEIPEVEGAQAEVHSRITPLKRSSRKTFFGEVVLPLVSGPASELTLRFRKDGKDFEARAVLERVPSEQDEMQIDSTCSPWRVEIARKTSDGPSAKPVVGGVVVAHCQVIRGDSNTGMIPVLDILLFLDGAGDSIRANGVLTKAEAPSIFRFRLTYPDQAVLLASQSGEEFEVKAKVPAKLMRGFLGVGLGPYKYSFSAPGVDVNTNSGVLTFYGSYQMSETARITAFNATAIHKNFFSDSGLYLKTDSLKLFDEAIQIYLMFGANLVGYRFSGKTHFNFGAPQGFEAVHADLFAAGRSGTVGAFIYPSIDGKSYYNIWLRYGSSKFFGELNYISIKTQFDSQPVATKGIGLSFGFPLARFF